MGMTYVHTEFGTVRSTQLWELALTTLSPPPQKKIGRRKRDNKMLSCREETALQVAL